MFEFFFQKMSFFLYKSLFFTISFNICQNVHFTDIFIKHKIFILNKNCCLKFFVCHLCFLINFFSLFISEKKKISFYPCTVRYKIFNFRLKIFFHFLNRSYGRFVFVFLFFTSNFWTCVHATK